MLTPWVTKARNWGGCEDPLGPPATVLELSKLFHFSSSFCCLRFLLGCLRQDSRPETKVFFVDPGNQEGRGNSGQS